MLRTVIFATMALAAVQPSELRAGPLQQAPVRVVATLPIYASLVREIGGSDIEVSAIADPTEDAHFVRPKPSFALDLRRAEAFVTTGLDLELWVPTLLDRAGNPDVIEGGRGYIPAAAGITLLDIPSVADRAAGDVHIYGNPHLTTDPLRTLQVARNITAGLKRVAPDRAARFDRGLASFTDRIYAKLFGERLVELLGGPTLEQLALNGTLFDFLGSNEFDGVRLTDELGGWLQQAEAFRGRQIICYHKNWTYFEDRFGVMCADFVESKPGIQPTPGHVSELINRMRDENIGFLVAAWYFQGTRVESIASRGGATFLRAPLSPGVVDGVDDYFSLVDYWVTGLARAFQIR